MKLRLFKLTIFSLSLLILPSCSGGGGDSDNDNSSQGASSETISATTARNVVSGLVNATNSFVVGSPNTRQEAISINGKSVDCSQSLIDNCIAGDTAINSPSTGAEVGVCSVSCVSERSGFKKIAECDFDSSQEFSTTCNGDQLQYRLVAFDSTVGESACDLTDGHLSVSIPLEYNKFQAIVTYRELDNALVDCSGTVNITFGLSLLPASAEAVVVEDLNCTIDGEPVNVDVSELTCS